MKNQNQSKKTLIKEMEIVHWHKNTFYFLPFLLTVTVRRNIMKETGEEE